MAEEANYIHCGKQSHWPKALIELSAFINDAMLRAGYELEESQSITNIAIKAMSRMAGGRQFYLPSGKNLDLALRDAMIFKEFNGRNSIELAEKHGMTQQNVYRIIKKLRESGKQARGSI